MAAPRDLQWYLDKVPAYHQDLPKFQAMLAGVLQPFVDAQAALAALSAAFDLDTAVGKQLDTVGEWIGRSRDVPVPVPNIWFSFGDPLRGFGRGYWRGSYSNRTTISELDDETFRKLLRAKILMNYWDGTIDGAQDALDAFFDDPETHVFVCDNSRAITPTGFFAFGQGAETGWNAGTWRGSDVDPQASASEMSLTVGVSGKLPPLIYLFLLAQDLVAIKPGGVRVDYSITSVDRTPLFGFGVENDFVAGFGTGSWGVSPDYLVNHPAT